MTRLLYFTRTQEREGGFLLSLGINERGGIYSSGGGNMNGRSFNES